MRVAPMERPKERTSLAVVFLLLKEIQSVIRTLKKISIASAIRLPTSKAIGAEAPQNFKLY
jgi:hypothetical protein